MSINLNWRGLRSLSTQPSSSDNKLPLCEQCEMRSEMRNRLMEYHSSEDEEWPIARMMRLQDEEEAGMRGRLTAPQNEVRKRQPKKKPSNRNDLLVDALRTKQMTLVDEQIYLHKVQQEKESINQEESQEKLMLIKTQRQIAEIELKEKQEIASIAKEEAEERLKLVKFQRQIAEIDFQKKQSES